MKSMFRSGVRNVFLWMLGAGAAFSGGEARAATDSSCGSAKIVFSGYAGTTELTNFPALVRISEAKLPDVDMSSFMSDGSDVRFYDADGNEIPHEIESWDSEGESLVWVRVPILSGRTSFVTMKWGATSPRRTNAKDVWPQFAGVWHMNELTNELASASGSGLTLKGAAAPTAVADGPIGGKALLLADMFTTPSFLRPPCSVPQNGYAVSGWYRRSAAAQYFCPFRMGEWQKDGWYVEYQGNTSARFIRNTTPTSANFALDYTKGWIYATFVYNNGKLSAYQNGVQTLALTDAKVTHDMGITFRLSSSLNTQYDEARVMSVCPSADWVAADYATQTAADFAVAEQGTNPSAPLPQNAWVVRPSLQKAVVKPGEELVVLGEPAAGTMTVTYDDAHAVARPTTPGWHTAHVGVEPTDSACGLDAVDLPYLVESSWASSSLGEAIIEVPANPKGTSLTDFPLMLCLSADSLPGVDMTTMADGGADLRFYDAAGNELAHDIEKFDRDGVSYIWVKLPTYTSAGTTIVMNWGVKEARATAVADTWFDFGGVWHMTTAGSIADASGHNLTLTGTSEGAAATLTSPRGCGVKIGSNMKASDFYAAAVGVPRNNYTISLWYYYPQYTSGEQQIFNKGEWASEGMYLNQTANTTLFLVANKNAGISSFPTGIDATKKWSFVTFVHKDGVTELFVNGTSLGTRTVADTKTTTYDFNIISARQYDEVRVRKSAVSADWAHVDWVNQQGLLAGRMTLVRNVTSTKTVVPIPVLATEATYDGTVQRPDVPASEYYDIDYGEGDYRAAGNYTITLTLKDTETTEWAGQTTEPKVYPYVIRQAANAWTESPSISKIQWKSGEAAATVSGASAFGPMVVRYDDARVEEMPLTPGFHVAYCSVAETTDWAGIAEVPLCYRVLESEESLKGDLTIRLQGYTGTSTLTNFPVLVRLSAAKIAGLDLSSFDATAPKLKFFDAAGKLLKHDIERWDPAGESLVWVLVPRVTGTTTCLSMQWSAARGGSPRREDAWGDDFAAVWHMDGTGDSRTDASGHGLDLTASADCAEIDGKVGRATESTVAMTAPDFFLAPYSVPKTDFSVSCWYRFPNYKNTEMCAWQKGQWADGGLYLINTSISTQARIVPNMGLSIDYVVNVNDCKMNWNHMTVSYTGGKFRIYANGNAPKVVENTGIVFGAFQFGLPRGNYYDEFRIRKSAPSDDWVKADYKTQSSETFCTYSLIRNAKRAGLVIFFE